MFFVKIFEMWNKDDHTRRLLIDRKDPNIVSANDEKQNKNQVSEVYSSTNCFDPNCIKTRVQMIYRILIKNFRCLKNVIFHR
jgi:hypothetical protein